MQTAPEISFRNFEPSPFVRGLIEKEIDKLEQYYDGIITVRVVLSQPHRSQESGRQFDVRIQISVPGDALVVDHSPGRDEDHEDPARTVRQAFAAAQRLLRDRVETLQDRVKVADE